MGEVEESSATPIQWESGSSKVICKINDGIIEKRLCPDYIIYAPFNEPLLVIEVAYSQMYVKLMEKVAAWMAFPSVVGVIAVNIEENPSFKSPGFPDNLPPKLVKEDWLTKISDCPKFGPLEVNGQTWIGLHHLNIEVHQRGKPKVEVTIVSNLRSDFLTMLKKGHT